MNLPDAIVKTSKENVSRKDHLAGDVVNPVHLPIHVHIPCHVPLTTKMAPYLTNQYNSTPQDQHFLTSPHYPKLTGVYTRLEEEEMNTPVYQKVDLITGRSGAAFLFRREGGKYRLLHNILR